MSKHELPKFILCPDCNDKYDDNKRRRVIDACGHPRCLACLSKDGVCPLCTRNRSSAVKATQRRESSECDSDSIKSQEVSQHKSRSHSVSIAIGRSSRNSWENRTRRASSFSRINRWRSSSQEESAKGKLTGIQERASNQERSNSQLNNQENSLLNLEPKTFDRRASFSSVLSRNSESFKKNAYRRSSSFCAPRRKPLHDKEAAEGFESRLTIPSKPRPRSLIITESENSSHYFEHGDCNSQPAFLLSRSKSYQEFADVVNKAASWLEDSRVELSARKCALSVAKIAYDPDAQACKCSSKGITTAEDADASDIPRQICDNDDKKFISNKSGLLRASKDTQLIDHEERPHETIIAASSNGLILKDAGEVSAHVLGKQKNHEDEKASDANEQHQKSGLNGSFHKEQNNETNSDQLHSTLHEEKEHEKLSSDCDYSSTDFSSSDDEISPDEDGSSSGNDERDGALESDDQLEDSQNVHSASKTFNAETYVGDAFQETGDDEDPSYLPAIRQLLYGKRTSSRSSPDKPCSPRRCGTIDNPFFTLEIKKSMKGSQTIDQSCVEASSETETKAFRSAQENGEESDEEKESDIEDGQYLLKRDNGDVFSCLDDFSNVSTVEKQTILVDQQENAVERFQDYKNMDRDGHVMFTEQNSFSQERKEEQSQIQPGFVIDTDRQLGTREDKLGYERNAAKEQEGPMMRRLAKRPAFKKASWSTSDLITKVEYLPSLKKIRRKRPSSLSQGKIEWKPEFVANGIDVDSFYMDSMDGCDDESEALGQNINLNHEDSNKCTTEGSVEIDSMGMNEVLEKKENCRETSSEEMLVTAYELNVINSCDVKDMASKEERLEIQDAGEDQQEGAKETGKENENTVDENNVVHDDIFDKHDSESTTGEISSNNDPLLASYKNRRILKFSKFGHLKHKKFVKPVQNHLESMLPLTLGLIDVDKMHEEALLSNKTDDWKTRNSQIFGKKGENGNSMIRYEKDTVPVVFVAEHDFREPIFVKKLNMANFDMKSQEKQGKAKYPASFQGDKKRKDTVYEEQEKRRKDEKARNVGKTNSMKYIKDKINRFAKWSKKGSHVDNEKLESVGNGLAKTKEHLKQVKSLDDPKHSRHSFQRAMHMQTDVNQNTLETSEEKTPKKTQSQKNTSLHSEIKEIQRLKKGPDAWTGSCANADHASITEAEDGIVQQTDDQASLTTVSTITITQSKKPLNKIDFDDSSISSTDTESVESILSDDSSFSDVSDSSSSSTISAAIEDSEMPEFRSPSRIQQDLAVLLERKVAIRSQGLEELDFHSLMPASKGKLHMSREWLSNSVHQLLVTKTPSTIEACRGLLFSGKNGCGKTTFLKSLVWNNCFNQFGNKLREKISNSILSYHFCCKADTETLSVAKFVLNMAAKLVDKDEFSLYTKQISENVRIRECLNNMAAEKDPATAFKEGILLPLTNLGDSFAKRGQLKQYLMLVDLADHHCVSCTADECIAKLLAENLPFLPNWIKLIVNGTKQSLQSLLGKDQLCEIELDNIANWDVQRDIYSFIEASLHKVNADGMQEAKIQKLADNIVTFSKGSFHVAMAAIQYVTSSFSSLHQLPVLMSLETKNMLSELFKLMFGVTERRRILAVSILDILYASQEPLTSSCLYKAIENGCSSQTVSFQEFEFCVEKFNAMQMIAESTEGRIYLSELAREWLHSDGKIVAGFNVRKGHNLLSLYYMKKLNNCKSKDVYRLAYHLASSNFGEDIRDEESRVSFLAWTFTKVFKDLTPGFMEACNVFHPLPEVYHLFLHTDLDEKMFESRYKKSPIVLASSLKQSRIVSLLLAHRRYSKETLDNALKEAIESGCRKTVDLLLDQKALLSNDNEADYLEIALKNRQLQIAMRLLDRTWSCDGQEVKQEAAQKTLCEACKEGASSIVIDLLKNDLTNVDAVDSLGRLPILQAVENKHLEIVKILIENGCSVNICDREGRTPLSASVINNHEAMLDLLVDSDAKIDMEDFHGRTAMMTAALHNRCHLVGLLFAEGAEINRRDHQGLTALSLACKCGSVQTVSFLLENRAEVNTADHKKQTALHHACALGNVKIVKSLLRHGANINQKDCNGVKPIEQAVSAGNMNIVNILLKNGAVVRKSCWNLAERNLESFLCLISYFEKEGNSMIKAGNFSEANSFFQRAVNRIESSRHRNHRKVLRIKHLCQQDSRTKFL